MGEVGPLTGVNVGWDLDGVVFDFLGSFRHTLLSKFDIALERIPSPKDWIHNPERLNAVDHWDMTEEEFEELYELAVSDHNLFLDKDNQFIIDGAIPVMNEVRELGGQNVIITARSWFSKDGPEVIDTLKWLGRNKIPYSYIKFDHNKTSVKTDFFIEDNVVNCEALLNAGTKAVLFDQPWNCVDYLPKVYTHKQYLEFILESLD